MLRDDPVLAKKINATTSFFKECDFDLQDTRTSYDYGITFIWTNISNESLGPEMVVVNTSSIYGEANILRYLNRLFRGASNLGSQSNDWIDKCTNQLVQKRSRDYLTYLNSKLTSGNSKFLVSGDKPGIEDYYNWSAIRSSGFEIKNLAGIKEWFGRLEASDMFIRLLNERL